MRIMAIADIHGDTEKIKRLSYFIEKNDPEVIVIAGDLTRFGPTSAADKILKELYKTGKPIVAITGNGDTPEIDRLLDQKKINLLQKPMKIKDVGFVGFGGPQGVMLGMGSLVMRYEPLGEKLTRLKTKNKVVVSHLPPLRTKDKVFSGQHTGSEFLRDIIEEQQPDLVISGHIHEDMGTYDIGKTTVVNTGALCEGYGAMIDLKSGTKPKVEFFMVD